MNSLQEYLDFLNNTKIILLVIGFLASLVAYGMDLHKNKDTIIGGIILLLILIWRIGCLPIPNVLSDRDAYAHSFKNIQYFGFTADWNNSDQILGIITLFISRFCDVDMYFIVLSFIYVGLYFFACRRLVGIYVVWLFLACILSMGFVSYGDNTIRAGLAISFLITGISLYRTPIRMYILFCISILTHFSMVIPVLMIIVSRYFNKTKLFFSLWLLSIPLSFVSGGFFQTLFSTFSSDKRVGYLTAENEFYNIGFRADFILYSMAPIIVGYYYIFKRGFKSAFYSNLYNAYILTNIFWILVIRANFSDRFAYLSWFMLPFLLVYPLLTDSKIVSRPSLWLATILLGETVFKLII